MSRLSFYVLKQLIGPVALFAFLMTCVIWLTQSLHFLDLVINRGQSAPTFLYLSMLALPSILVLILPIAFFFGVLYALSRLNSDSELVVMAAAGFSRAQLAVPMFVAAATVMALTYLCGLYLMPAGQRAMADKVVDINADIGAAMLNEGAFNTPAKGLTVFIREIDSSGGIHGALVHDNRNPKSPITYFVESGRIVQTPSGMRFVMLNATVELASKNGATLKVLKFARYPFDLDQFTSAAPSSEGKAKDRYLGELLTPDPKLKAKTRRAFIAEAHSRIAEPFYCIAFALIALAAVTQGRRARGAHLLRMTIACFAAAGLRIAGYGVAGLAAGNSAYCILFYLFPLIGIAGAAIVLAGGFPKPLPGVAPVGAGS